MGEMSFQVPLSDFFSHSIQALLQFLLATPVCLWGAWPFYKLGLKSFKTKNFDMFTLISLGVGVSYFYSVFIFIFSSHESSHLYFESGAMIVLLILLGQVIEQKASSKTSLAIEKLMSLQPRTAQLIVDSQMEKEIPLEEIKLGDHLRIRPGEKIPLDGIILDGKSSVDESMISGEPIPVYKEKNSKVIGGTINGTGSLVMKVEKLADTTLLAQIIQMILTAQETRPQIQKLVDKVSGIFVPLVILISFITFLIWFSLGPEPSFSLAIMNMIAVLIIACPCALGLATPMSIMVATGKAASRGVLFKNAEAIETLCKVKTIILDKTGTITEGKPKVVQIQIFQNISESELLFYAASLEQHSEHPLAKGILEAAQERKITLQMVNQFESITGKGVKGLINNQWVYLGNKKLMEDLKINFDIPLSQNHQSVVYIGIKNQLMGILIVEDPVKSTSQEAIKELRHLGMKVIMLTGDQKTTAEYIAQKVYLDEVIAEVLPQDKLQVITRLKDAGQSIAMVGDGINDAPALAKADVGIAMGTGTDIAMESAGVTLIQGDLRGIVRAFKISQHTMRNIKQNLFFAFIYNVLGIAIAAGVLYPVNGMLLDPMIGALAMSLSSISVILNSLMLFKIKV